VWIFLLGGILSGIKSIVLRLRENHNFHNFGTLGNSSEKKIFVLNSFLTTCYASKGSVGINDVVRSNQASATRNKGDRCRERTGFTHPASLGPLSHFGCANMVSFRTKIPEEKPQGS
jgi:hypothetical protein